MAPGQIVLMSDFGHVDGYFSAMRGSILSYDADLIVHDGPHDVPAFSLSSAAYILHTLVAAYPPRFVFVCVVDPGVGSPRRELIADLDGKIVICPDNGLVTLAAAMSHESRFMRASSGALDSLRTGNAFGALTFDGRDLFAPLAARIASNGLAAVADTRPVDPVRMPDLAPIGPETAGGHVIHVDRFGNLISNVLMPADATDDAGMQARFGDVVCTVGASFSSVEVGDPVAYRGSYGFLELAVREGNAFLELGVGVLESVELISPAGQPNTNSL